MSLSQLTETSTTAIAREATAVVVAAEALDERLRACVESVCAHTGIDQPIVVASPHPPEELAALLDGCRRPLSHVSAPLDRSTQAGHALSTVVDRALALLAAADVALLSAPCIVTPGWLDRLRRAAYADTNTASASALSDRGTSLALSDGAADPSELATVASAVAERSLELRPRLGLIVGPCVYLRRDALELLGGLDRELALAPSLEVDFAQRCVAAGLAHVAADDTLVGLLKAPEPGAPAPAIAPELRARYPYLSEPPATGASAVLPRALATVRAPDRRLSVTIDARTLGATITGTQRHVFELIRALAATGRLQLRLLISADTSAANVEALRSLPGTELLAVESLDTDTPRTTLFHRPQQVFGPADMRVALRLGERIVLNQLDLIAYRNPLYHANATAWLSHRRASRQALAAADRVIVFSEHTRMELLSDELLDEDRVRVIPPGLDHQAPLTQRPPQPLSERLDRDGERKRFLLCLGTDFRHKNRVFALRLQAALRERHAWDGELVFAGTHVPHGSSATLERELLDGDPELAGMVRDLGAVEEEKKAWLMAHASALVYPSTYEGFGLVPFESALSGTPCVFAPRSSLAEVLPAAAAAIVPWDPVASAERTHTLLTDPAARERQLAALLEPARALTWAGAAAQTLQAYEEAIVAPTREAIALSRDELAREQELRELVAAQDAMVEQLVGERRHAQRMYEELNTEVGFALGLIGPNGALPEDVQRALLALSAHPGVSGPAFGAVARMFRALRALSRGVSRD